MDTGAIEDVIIIIIAVLPQTSLKLYKVESITNQAKLYNILNANNSVQMLTLSLINTFQSLRNKVYLTNKYPQVLTNYTNVQN